jgi:hypothetical protein
MKTNTSAKNIQSVRLRLRRPHLAILGLTIAAALAAPLARADTMSLAAVVPVYTITLTELSSTSLTATYNGPGATFSTPVNTGPDAWTVSYTLTQGSSFSLVNFIYDWTEPEEPNEVNEVSHGVVFGNINNLYVVSDESLFEYGGGGGVTNTNNTPVPVGTDNGQTVFLKFDDQAATSENGATVPESGSTLALFGFSITGFAALTRFRMRQLNR